VWVVNRVVEEGGCVSRERVENVARSWERRTKEKNGQREKERE